MKKELEKTYTPGNIEGRLYQKWLDKKYFAAKVNPAFPFHTKKEAGFVYVENQRNFVAYVNGIMQVPPYPRRRLRTAR